MVSGRNGGDNAVVVGKIDVLGFVVGQALLRENFHKGFVLSGIAVFKGDVSLYASDNKRGVDRYLHIGSGRVRIDRPDVHGEISDLNNASARERLVEFNRAPPYGSNEAAKEGMRGFGKSPNALLRANASALFGTTADNSATVDADANDMLNVIREGEGADITIARGERVKLLGKLDVYLAHYISDSPVKGGPKESVAALVLPKGAEVIHHAAVGVNVGMASIPKGIKEVRKGGHGLLVFFEIELLKLLDVLKADIVHGGFPVGGGDQRAVAVGIAGHIGAGRFAKIGQGVSQSIYRLGPLSALELQIVGNIACGDVD